MKAPFPWYGGKSRAAAAVWVALGDVSHYVEPFAGSLAVLLNRPHPANRTYYSETVNDADALLVNAWRAIQRAPDDVALHASWPVSEADMHARHVALVRWREERLPDLLAGDAEHFDARMAGWWLWGVACWIGSGWCAGIGPWWPDETGRLTKRKRGVHRKLPHLSDNGQGVNSAAVREPGVARQLPHLTGDGRGVNAPQLREPGVSRQLPHLTGDGQGVNAPQLREPSDYHPITMPKVLAWMRALSARLRHVRICNGDWKRVCTDGAIRTLSCRDFNGGIAGVFLDPPYADTADRDPGLYAVDSLDVAHRVREWCLANTAGKPWLRIVLAGFDGEHGSDLEAAGWRSVEWFGGGNLLTGGMGHQQARERLWLSPSCLDSRRNAGPLFAGVAT